MKIKLYRNYSNDRIVGKLVAPTISVDTLELPYINNMHNISAIPEGVYRVQKSQFWGGKHKGKPAFRLLNVPSRSGILIHRGTRISHTDGCILVGSKYDEKLGILHDTRSAFSALWEHLPHEFTLEVKRANPVRSTAPSGSFFGKILAAFLAILSL